MDEDEVFDERSYIAQYTPWGAKVVSELHERKLEGKYAQIQYQRHV